MLTGVYYFPTDYGIDIAELARALEERGYARLFDAGVAPGGSAYLVMEYVDGVPLTTYCDAQQLRVEERLGLFQVVCEATQHAHQALVVDRDLKPSNIFVSRAGEVELLDFGASPACRARDQRCQTDGLELFLTPAYAGARAGSRRSGDHGDRRVRVRRRSPRAADRTTALRLVLDMPAPPPARALSDIPSPPAARFAAPCSSPSRGRSWRDWRRRPLAPDDAGEAGQAVSRRSRRHRPQGAQARARTTLCLGGTACRGHRPLSRRAPGDRRARHQGVSREPLRRATSGGGRGGRAPGRPARGVQCDDRSASAAGGTERDRARSEQKKTEQVMRLFVDLFKIANPKSDPGWRPSIDWGVPGACRGARARSGRSQPELTAALRHVLGLVHFARNSNARARRSSSLAEQRRLFGENAIATLTVQVDLRRVARLAR